MFNPLLALRYKEPPKSGFVIDCLKMSLYTKRNKRMTACVRTRGCFGRKEIYEEKNRNHEKSGSLDLVCRHGFNGGGILPLSPIKAQAASDKTTGLNVNTPSQEEISSYINDSGAVIYQKDTFAKETTKMDTLPTTADSPSVDLSDIGKLSDETQKNALAVLNNIRYIAGLDEAGLSTDESLNQDIQAGTYVNYLNQKISHYPTKPANASDELYESGARGTKESNLFWNAYSSSYAALGWTSDEDSHNIAMVGHRRWVINPTMGKTIFGSAGTHYAMYSFDRSHSSSASGVAWPAHNMPIEYNVSGSSLVWSYSYGQDLTRSDVTVELTKLDKEGNIDKTWTFDNSTTTDTSSDLYFNVNSEGYGQTGCVIFRPDGIDSYHDGDTFHVNIKNSGTQIADYDVNFFSLNPVTAIKLDDSYQLVEGFDKYIEPKFEPSDAKDKGFTVKIKDEDIAKYDEKTGKITGLNAGTTQAVFTSSNGKVSAETTLNVVPIKLSLDEAYTFAQGNTFKLYPTSDPSGYTNYTAKVDDESIVKYDESSDTFTALKIRTTKATLTSTNGKATAVATINVIDPKIDDPKPRTFVYNGKEQKAYDSSDPYKKSAYHPVPIPDDFVVSATEPGSYFCYVDPASGFEWKDKTSNSGKVYRKLAWTIEKAPNELTTPLTCPDVVYPAQPDPKAAAKAGTIQYKYSDSASGTYEEEKPSKPGTYYVKAFVTGDNHYKDMESDPVKFTIEKAENSWTIPFTADDVWYEQPLSVFAAAKGGSVEYLYSTSRNGKYAKDYEPKDAGTYYVKAHTDGNDYYKEMTSEPVSFQIKQVDNEWIEELTISDIVYGETLEPSAQVDYGEVTYKYCSTENGIYTETVPTDAGTYFVKAYVEESRNYTGLESDPVSFEIQKAENTWTLVLKAANKVYDKKAVDFKAEAAHGQAEVLYSDSADGDFTAAAPVNAGKYWAKASVAESKNYQGLESDPVAFEIQKADNTWTLELKGQNKTYDGKAADLKAEAANGQVQILYSDSADGDFTDEAPVNAGKYWAKASVAGDENYKPLESDPVSFEITKADNSWTTGLTIADVDYKEELQLQPYAKADHGDVTYEYYYRNGNGDYTKTAPKDAGTYYVKAYADGGQNYTDLESDLVSFEIRKAKNSWKLELKGQDKVYDSKTIELKAEAAYGQVQILYSDSADGTFKDEKPVDAGKYWAKASVAESKNYQGLEPVLVSFEITQAENSWAEGKELKISDAAYGESLAPSAQADYGDVTYKYCNTEDGDFTDKAPENVGTHYVKAYVAETRNFKGLTSEAVKFEITRAENSWKSPAAVSDLTYGETPKPSAEPVHGNAADVTFKYSTDENGTYTDTVPADAGTYYVKAYLPEQENYKAMESKPVSFKIAKAKNSWTQALTIADIAYGKEPAPAAKAAHGDVTYKYCSSRDGDYSKTAPKAAGTYYVKAYADGGKNYQDLVSEPVSFTITADPKKETNTPDPRKETNTPEDPAKKPITDISKGATVQQAEKFITGQKSDNDVKGSKFGLLRAKASKVTKSSIKLTWKKVPGAKCYVVYANKCGKANHFKKYKTVSGTSLTQKKLKKGTYYKYLIMAVDKNGNVITASKTIHASTAGNAKKANFTGLKLKKTKVTLKKGKTFKIKATELKKAKTKVQRHRKPAFESSNTKIVTVSSSGKLKVKKKGRAKIYVYTQNGIAKTVTVTVK